MFDNFTIKMTIKAKSVHTNIIAKDWKRFARFYEQVLGIIELQ
jgi:predicted enzyme related to lactoylglutathione lyase